ncbi:hypothetical protein Tco_1451128 [Tanacetum coccineum]
MGYEKLSLKLTFYKAFFSPQWKFFIHTILQCLSAKTTAWNEFSSTMASAIICLATNQKFNFSKYIFESMVKNLDNVGNFLMYPRFVQVFLDKQLEGMQSHKRIYDVPSHTKKIFGNMKRVGKGFSGRETPLFPTMVAQNQAEMGEADEAVNKEMDDCLVRAATTASSLETEQDSGNIDKTQSKATPNEPSSSGTSSSGGPKRQETMGDTTAQTWSENVSKLSNDPLLARVLALETINTTQAKRIEKKDRKRTHKLKRLYKGRIANIDANKDIYWVNVQTDEDMFGVNELDGDEVIVESVDVVKTAEETRNVVEEVTVVTIPISAATTTTTTTAITDVEMTLAQALAELKSAKPKATTITTTPTLTTTATATIITVVITRPRAKWIVIYKQEQAPTPTVSSQQPSQVKVQDKCKSKMVEPEPVKKMSKKDLLRLDEELAFKLQDEKEEERLAREKAQQVEEANIAWDDVQARLFEQFLEKRRKHFAAKRAEENRNRPSIRAQQRSIMYTYLKNMEGWKPKSLKNKTKLVEESSKKEEAKIAHESSLKRAGEELEQESSKKQKLEEDKESEELKKCLEINPDDGDDVTINATPLSTKSPTIVDYKIYKEGKKSYFQIIRGDDNS